MRTPRFISLLGMAAMLSASAWSQSAATTPVEPVTTKSAASSAAPAAPAQQTANTPPPQPVEKREPTAQEIEVLLDGIKHLVDDSTAGLVPVQHPDGSVSIDLQGRFQNVSIAKRNADGSISTECVGNQKEARRFLATPKGKPAITPKPTAALEVK